MANEMIKFYKGLEASLPASGVNGALYITTDEGAIYLGTGTGMKRLGDFVQVANVDALPAKAHESCLYYCVAENILAKWNGTEWKQINKQPTAEEMKGLLGLGSLAYKSEVVEGDLSAELKEKVNAAAEGNHSHSNKALLDTYTQTEADLADAVAKKHAHANQEELDKIVVGDKAKWDAVAADHLTSADKTALENSIKEAKKAGTDANTALETYKVSNDARVLAVEEDITEIIDGTNGILAQAKSYSDGKLATAKTEISAEIDADVKVVNDALEAYKSSNDTALAGVKATAEAAAVKTEVESALSGKVDKVEGKSLISDSEITRLAGVHNYDDAALVGRVSAAEGKIGALETESAKHALKSEVEAEFAKYTKTDDLPTDLGDFTNNAGYAKTVDVNAELDKKADKTQVATDIANAIAPLATTEALNGVKATAEAAAVATEVEAALALKADKSVVDAMYTNAQIDGFVAGAKSYADGLITDANLDQYTTEAEVKSIVDGVIASVADSETYNSLTKLVDYIDQHGGEAADMAEAIADHETRIDALENMPASEITTAQISNWDGEVGAKALAESKTTTAEVKAQIEAYGYATTGYADNKASAAQSAAEAKAAELDAALKTELQGEIDADVKVVADDLAGYKTSNDEEVAKKANSDDVYAKSETYTKTEVDAMLTWGEF